MPTARLIALLLLLLAGVAARRAMTLPWARGTATDGAPVSVSPLGVTRLDAEAVACRWHSGSGEASLCAPAEGEAGAYYRLELAGPLLALAGWLFLVAAVLGALPLPGTGVIGALTALAAGVGSAAAAGVFGTAISSALAVASPGALRPAGVGWGIALVLPLVGLVTTVLLWRTRYRGAS